MRRAFRIVSLSIVVVLVVSLSFAAGFGTGTRVHAGVPVAAPSDDSGDVIEQFRIFWEAWRIVERDFVDKSKLEPDLMTYGAIKGMLESLDDPYTVHIDPQAYKMEQEDLGGSYSGIGAHVSKQDDNQLVIVSPIEGSPAAAAGLKPGTAILAVNDEETLRMTLMEAVNKIRGPRGTKVRLTVLFPGETKPTTLEIERDDVKTASVSFRMLPDDNLAYLRITQFTLRTNDEVKDALAQLKQQSPSGLIVDLRHDPGGYLDSVVAVTSQFLKDGVILYEVNADGDRRPIEVRSGGTATELPVVVLVDKGSASASEIFAGAVQDRKRGVLIGEETFGKGTVTQIHRLSDGSAVNIATARWLTPNGNLIEGKGIAPDIEVILTEEDANAGRDTQLERAVEYLKNGQ